MVLARFVLKGVGKYVLVLNAMLYCIVSPVIVNTILYFSILQYFTETQFRLGNWRL